MVNDIHTWVEARLSEYVDGQLAPADKTQLEAHLRECGRCQARLESLRWTVSLLRQAPAPVPARQFTLPVAQKIARPARPGFVFLRAATVMATFILGVVISFDLYSQFGFRAVPASAPSAPVGQFAAPAPTQNIALAPQPAAPTSAPLPSFRAVQPTAAPTQLPLPAPQAPPQPASAPGALPTATRVPVLGAAETQATSASADAAQKSAATVPAAPAGARSAVTSTVTTVPSPLPSFAPTATPTATTAPTQQLQARVEPTRGRDDMAEPQRTIPPSLRVVEFGLFAVVVLLGGLTIFAWRRK